jgi:class 3 adenylate cyclase/tetratricopeptide (TPR) repeat protein
MESLSSWLQTLGLEQYAPLFERNGIDLRSLPLLGEGDLADLGVLLGHRRLLLKAIASLPEGQPIAQPVTAATGAMGSSDAGSSQAERRQLTVLFCDLIESTALTQSLDPEALRELMQAYQRECSRVVERYAGHIAQFLGDGIMVYFGWPRAHEDDAERAVRSGLEIVRAVKQVPAPAPLRVRIGIATGPVVVGDSGTGNASASHLAVGETPNLAARLQALAATDQIVIAPGTRRLLGSTFEYQDLGRHALKGIIGPVHASLVLGESRTEGRFEAAHGHDGLSPLVGREEEIAMLLRRWEDARAGEGRVVLLTGEPGIGKSRIAQALCERVEEQPHLRLRYQCSPFHTQSALHPVIQQLERAAGLARDDSVETKLDKLEELLAETVAGDNLLGAVAPLFAALLSLPSARYPALNLTPQKQKDKTLDALVEQLAGLATKRPLLVVFEDAHWIDPTTQELLGLLITRVATLPALLLVTYRPEFSPRWGAAVHVTTLPLGRLDRKLGARLAAAVSGGKTLPQEVLEQIVVKTDGVPLFVEELTKTVLESGLLIDAGDRYELAGSLPPLAIPSTLHDSLMARLDRLAPVKETAQLGACIGREFGHELLAAVAPMEEKELDSALEQLSDAQLLFRRGTPPDATYVFKHALVQDAAYASLLKSKRQHYHQRIAAVMVERFAAAADAQPEFVAHQFSEAGLANEAIVWWQKAGKRASLRAAPAECVANYENALKILAAMPVSPARDNTELGLQVALGFALMLLKGWAAPETGTAIERAATLGRKLSGAQHESSDLYWSLRAPGTYYMTRGRHLLADEIAEECLRVAARGDDIDARIDSHNLRAMCAFAQGKLSMARQHAERGLSLYGPTPRKHPLLLGQDTKIRLSWWHAWSLWWQGYPDQALERGREVEAYSRQSTHPFERCWALMILGTVHIFRGEPWADGGAMATAARLAAEHEFSMFKALMPCYHAGLLTLQGNPKDAISAITGQLPAIQASGAQWPLTLIYGFLANAYLRLAEPDEGLEAADEGLRIAARNAETFNAAELHRLRGELLEIRAPSTIADAQREFETALEVARRQEAKALELRAAVSLAQLWGSQGARTQARQLLAPIYSWFAEGFDTSDLREARNLLGAELRE